MVLLSRQSNINIEDKVKNISMGKTKDNLKPSVSNTTKIIDGDVLNSIPDVEYLKKWVETFK